MSKLLNLFSVDFLAFLMKRRHLKNFKKSANKSLKNVKINMIKKKQFILTLSYSQISKEKYVSKRLISFL